MKLKLIPKNEQELSKLFVLIFPLTLLLSSFTSFLKDAYFTFANLIPNNRIFNYGFLDTLNNQATYGLLFATCICLSFTYLFSKSLGRIAVLFPLLFLTLLGLVGTEFLDLLFSFFYQDRINVTGNSSLLIILKILVGFGLFGLASLNLLAKKESSIFASAQFIYGAVVFYFISLLISRSELVVFTDSLMITSLHTSTLIYVGVSFIFLAIIHFLMTKPLGATLFNKTLTAITFWGFLFLLPWTNFKYYFGSIIPNWLENVSIYLSLSLLIPLLAFSVNYVKTIQTKEDEGNKSSSLMSFSVVIFLITNLLHIISSFENILPLVGLTNFQNVINQGYIGSLVLAMISFVYYLIPKLFGRSVKYSRLEDLIFSGFKFLYPVLLINNFLIGVNSGYSWNAGANAGSPTIYGEGFNMVQRSAEARAQASGVSVDDVLNSWAGGESVAASAAPAPKEEAPVEEVKEEAPVEEVKEEILEETTEETAEESEAQEVIEEVVEEVIELKNESSLAFISGVLLIGVFTFVFAFVIPKNQSISAVESSLNNSVSVSSEILRGAEIYGELNCQSCHTQNVRTLIPDTQNGKVLKNKYANAALIRNVGTIRLGPDLSTNATREPTNNSQWLKRYLVDSSSVNRDIPHPNYEFLDDNDLEYLVTYLLSLGEVNE